MPTIINVDARHGAERIEVRGKGHSIPHQCRDAKGATHRQRLPLGSVRGVFYLDAICPYCGVHYLWVADGQD
jgi:hypothetical protein